MKEKDYLKIHLLHLKSKQYETWTQLGVPIGQRAQTLIKTVFQMNNAANIESPDDTITKSQRPQR